MASECIGLSDDVLVITEVRVRGVIDHVLGGSLLMLIADCFDVIVLVGVFHGKVNGSVFGGFFRRCRGQ